MCPAVEHATETKVCLCFFIIMAILDFIPFQRYIQYIQYTIEILEIY